jgi:hypothetical protein
MGTDVGSVDDGKRVAVDIEGVDEAVLGIGGTETPAARLPRS